MAVTDVEKYLFNIDNAEQFLRNTAVGAIRSIIGSTRLDFAIGSRREGCDPAASEGTAHRYPQASIKTGIFGVDLKFQDIEPQPATVASAFAQVTNSREEKNTKINEANEYRNERIPKARGEAPAPQSKRKRRNDQRILNAMGDVAQFHIAILRRVREQSSGDPRTSGA